MSTKAGTSFERPTGDQAAVEIFVEALPKSAPQALVSLRDTPFHEAAVADWARSHHLESRLLVRTALDVRREWEEQPTKAEPLIITRWVTLDGITKPINEPEPPKPPYWAQDDDFWGRSLPACRDLGRMAFSRWGFVPRARCLIAA